MRKVINIDKDWKFSKEASFVPSTFPSDWESIDLPYTFNGEDRTVATIIIVARDILQKAWLKAICPTAKKFIFSLTV